MAQGKEVDFLFDLAQNPRLSKEIAAELLQPNRAASGVGELRVRKTDAPDRAQEDVGERWSPCPQTPRRSINQSGRF